ncbi:fibronectin type III domain-containing protein [Jidongwangia harbinensis]|uniref:fibronectin type III domain-containing protein n=1 Tax=Jidongwangia harbinensis TaxID=2878561 RepID=UPI001CD96DAD|nr:fibronectin type III domain-containing protein [Jidongwangia harbinensis]MCA2219159.1 fibronectin type III domain-containing protein [Jidongwangia harbinensis]
MSSLAATLAAVLLAASPAPAGGTGPATPTEPWASTFGTGISLSWEQPRSGARATSFRVYEDDAVVARVSTTAAYLEVPFGSSHTYTVAAVDQRGRESARTAPVTGQSRLSGVNPECLPAPGVPVTVTAVTASAVSVSWTRHPLGGELELRVDGASLGWTSLTSARIGGLAPGTAHQVTLYRENRCHVGGGENEPVGTVTATTAAGGAARPAAPADLTVTGRTDSTVGLSWTAPPGPAPARYAVYDGATPVAVTTGTSVTVDRLYHATWHRFTVAALDAAGNESAHSPAAATATATCLAAPPSPEAVSAVAVSPSSVRLSWMFEAAATSYTVFDGAAPVATTRYPEAILTGLASASRHAYRVVATLPQECGESPRSRRVEVSTPAGPAARPAAPASLTVTGNAPGPSAAQVTLSWPPASGATAGYRVYEGTRVAGETTGTTLSLTLAPATTHEYLVVAVSAAGPESAPSPRVTVHATFLPPP